MNEIYIKRNAKQESITNQLGKQNTYTPAINKNYRKITEAGRVSYNTVKQHDQDQQLYETPKQKKGPMLLKDNL